MARAQAPGGRAGHAPPNPTADEVRIGYVHGAAAYVFLLALSYFCIRLFPKSGDKPLTEQKRMRNRIYRISGWTIIACLVLIAVYVLSERLRAHLEPFHPLYFVELVAFWSFGIAWLVKGRVILDDG